MTLVTPAVLPSSRYDLTEKLNRFTTVPSITRIQIDVVDGRFASPMSWPYTAPNDIPAMTSAREMLPHLDRIEYEIDLMCLDAERATETWLSLGASRLTFHAESILDLSKFLTSMRKRYGDVSATFGVALNVTSDLSLIEPHLEQIEYVQFMGIASIGKQGQPFDRRVLEKIRVFHKQHPDVTMQVDGGVTLASARELVALGVSNLIVGSALARAADIGREVEKFETLQTPFGV